MISRLVALAVSVLVAVGCSTGAEVERRGAGMIYEPKPVKTPEIRVRPVSDAHQATFDWDRVAQAVAYPDFARRAEIEGTVPLTLIVASPVGSARGGRLVSLAYTTDTSDCEILAQAAFRGVASAGFAPGPESSTEVEVMVEFSLRETPRG